MEENGPVRDVLDLDSFERADGVDDVAPSKPPADPIAVASSANEPGRLSRWTRNVALNDADGCGTLI
jgi:hypothetical protein